MIRTLLVSLAAAAAVFATGCADLHQTTPLPSLVANIPPNQIAYPQTLYVDSIGQQQWSWVTGQVRAQSAVAGHITGTTVCDLHAGQHAVNKAEADKLHGYFNSIWKEPAAPPAGGAILIAPKPGQTGTTPAESLAFSCDGATPYFVVNGVGIRPDFVFVVVDPNATYMELTVEALSLEDGNILAVHAQLPVANGTVSGGLQRSDVYAANVKQYLHAPIAVAYIEGAIAALRTATYLVEQGTNPPQGVYLEGDGTNATLNIARFIQR